MDGTLALSTIKSFREIMPPEDYAEFLKSEDSEKLRAFPEVAEFVKGEMPEQFKKKEDKEPDDKDDEKPGDKKDDKEPDKDEDDKKEKDEKPWEGKAVVDEMMKGLEDQLNVKFKTITDYMQKSLELDTKVDELQKAVETVTGLVEKIAGMPLGTKAIKAGAAANFFEKAFGGEMEDDNGKKVLSVTMNKEQVLKSLEEGMKKAVDAELIKSYEGSIVRYNGGGGTIGQDVAVDLFENHGVRLTK